MTDKFVAEVLRLRTDLRYASASSWFYLHPAKRIVAGFVCERVRDRAYVARCARPICEDTDSWLLAVGERLERPNDLINAARMRPAELAEEFVNRIEAVMNSTMKIQEPACFLEYVEGLNVLANPRCRWLYALGLLLVGRLEDAERHTAIVAASQAARTDSRFSASLATIRSAMRRSPDDASETLAVWENLFRVRFKVE